MWISWGGGIKICIHTLWKAPKISHLYVHYIYFQIFGHWRCYFLLKARFYAAYAYNFAGENLLAEDKCGEAIRALQESQKCELIRIQT